MIFEEETAQDFKEESEYLDDLTLLNAWSF